MQWQEWPASAATGNFIRKTDRPNAIETLSGSIARAPFVDGEPIREAKLVNAKGSGFMAAILPTGMRAISTQISPETGAGGFILPNDHVDVILTRRDRDAEKAAGGDTHSSETILTNVRVLAIDQNVEEKDGQKVVVGKTATLELTPTPDRNAGAVAATRHAVAGAAQHHRRIARRAASRRQIGRAPRRREHRPLWRRHDDDTEMIERGETGTWR